MIDKLMNSIRWAFFEFKSTLILSLLLFAFVFGIVLFEFFNIPYALYLIYFMFGFSAFVALSLCMIESRSWKYALSVFPKFFLITFFYAILAFAAILLFSYIVEPVTAVASSVLFSLLLASLFWAHYMLVFKQNPPYPSLLFMFKDALLKSVPHFSSVFLSMLALFFSYLFVLSTFSILNAMLSYLCLLPLLLVFANIYVLSAFLFGFLRFLTLLFNSK